MSNQSGVSEQIIALPKGGGALAGIGEKFAPDLHTGTGNFTVPISIPAGRNGFHPQLTLAYSSGQGAGLFGLGWALSVPGVARKTSHGVPRYDDTHDVFLLSGAEDLIPVARSVGITSYRPRTEGLFAQIDHILDPVQAHDYWEVRTKDGLVSRYGTPGQRGRDPAIVAKPTDDAKVFAWRLTETTDPFGNRIVYAYEREPVRVDGPHMWDQCYLSEIRYGDFGPAANPQFLVTIHFTYEDRPDPFSDYRAGFEIRTTRRCTRIDVVTHAGADTPVATVHIRYADMTDPSMAARDGTSLLTEIRIEGHSGALSESLPPLAFDYTRFTPDTRTFVPVTGTDLPGTSLAHPELEQADLFGCGLPDLFQLDGPTVRRWRNLGNARYDLPRPMRDAPAGVTLADPTVQLLDANGDGRLDLMVATDQITGYYPLNSAGTWDRRSFVRFAQAPSTGLSKDDPELRLFDLDGDGVTDALRSGIRFECFFNDPETGWTAARRIERDSLDVFPDVSFADPRVKLATMTPSGLTDIVLIHDGLVEYWPSLGRGDFAPRIRMRHSPHLPWGYDPRRVLLGDVDGDGLADIVFVEDTRVTLWLNESGNAWSEPITIEGTPPVTDADAVRLVDLLGSGIRGVLWSRDADGLTRDRMFFLDFTGGRKPYLLSEIDNNRGALTRIGYAPSTTYYLADEARLATRWKTTLPFPVQVVARTEVIDTLSGGKLTTEYRYHHGYWDGAERE
ncbi:MAG: FG-GAP-like repeat-containing protein, partial [Thermoplasmata archaeon]|nr:FG-GAP-like repeat-containing protein [Thermoplasmata archaeon]